jgi:hypothetical protein
MTESKYHVQISRGYYDINDIGGDYHFQTLCEVEFNIPSTFAGFDEIESQITGMVANYKASIGGDIRITDWYANHSGKHTRRIKEPV